MIVQITQDLLLLNVLLPGESSFMLMVHSNCRWNNFCGKDTCWSVCQRVLKRIYRRPWYILYSKASNRWEGQRLCDNWTSSILDVQSGFSTEFAHLTANQEFLMSGHQEALLRGDF